jgi:murein L,D-transpeptidase YafK
VFKIDRLLELWAKNKSEGKFQLLKSYQICSTSGKAGPKREQGDLQIPPKREQGDLQIPEGFYYIDRFNPVSNFYLSLGINYPNDSDRVLGVKGKLGGDIFIHGNCVTIGCIPITDDKIKELYLVCVIGKSNGQNKIPVHIFPTILNEAGYEKLKNGNTDSKLLNFWMNLKTGYKYFETKRELPVISVNQTTGSYIFKDQ